ncbi:MAG: hypothetical protein JST84_04840 [Acidobacteria bacterium]|nr:hypothetical protein [Acidobacteriota bacterium]
MKRAFSYIFLLLLFSLPTYAQAGGGGFSTIMARLVSQGYNMIEMIREQLETPLMGYLDTIAFWVAVIVMIGSFLRLFREDNGMSENLYWWCIRLLVCMALFGFGPRIITSLHGAGVSLTQIDTVKTMTERVEGDFDEKYAEYVKGMLTVKPVNTSDPEELIGILYDKSASAGGRNITTIFSTSSWNLTNIFALLSVSRGIMEFAYVFLMILSEFLTIALRLFAPFAIAVAIDKALAGRITYPFLQSVLAFCLVMPIVTMILGILANLAGTSALLAIGTDAIGSIDPTTANLVVDQGKITDAIYGSFAAILVMFLASLTLFLSPVISYKLMFGQVFEGIAGTVSGWMGAAVGSAIEFMGLRASTAIQAQAERTQATGAYLAEQARQGGSLEAAKLGIQARQITAEAGAQAGATSALAGVAAMRAQATQMAQAQFGASAGQAMASTTLQTSLSNISATREQKGIGAGLLGLTQNADTDTWKAKNENAANVMGGLGGGILPVAGSVSGLAANKLIRNPTLTQENQYRVSTGHEVSLTNSNAVTEANKGQVASFQAYQDASIKVAAHARDQQIGAANTAAGIQAGGINKSLGIQLNGIRTGAGIEQKAAQVNFEAAMKAASINRDASFKAADLRAVSQMIQNLSRDIGRRAEQSMANRF